MSKGLLQNQYRSEESGESWHQLKQLVQPLFVGCHASQQGNIAQANELTSGQKRVLDEVSIKAPKRCLDIPTPKDGIDTPASS